MSIAKSRSLLLSACATALLVAGTTAGKAEVVVTQSIGLRSFEFNILLQGVRV